MKVTLYDLYKATTSYVFIRYEKFQYEKEVKEYVGESYGKDLLVTTIKATSYPMYKDVIEVTVRPKP